MPYIVDLFCISGFLVVVSTVSYLWVYKVKSSKYLTHYKNLYSKDIARSLNGSISILVVDNNFSDVVLINKALDVNFSDKKFNYLLDYKDVEDYLYQRGTYKDSIRPEIILLGLSSSMEDQLDVVNKIRSDSNFHGIPIVAFTNDKSEKMLTKSHELGINAIIEKPKSFVNLVDTLKVVGNFWQVANMQGDSEVGIARL